MKVLLLGDYSGLHVYLAEGLRDLGHSVTLASDGNGYKNYYRDIDISWTGEWRYFKMIKKLLTIFPRFVGYDVVQLIGMPFLDLRPLNNELVYRFLKRFNGYVFLGSNTIETEYMKYAFEVGYKTSFANNKEMLISDPWTKEVSTTILNSHYTKIHKRVTNNVNGITACCADYNLACQYYYSEKTAFIPLPFNVKKEKYVNTVSESGKLKFFLGKQSYRVAIKGMDVIEEALLELVRKHPDKVDITIVDSVPYEEYKMLMEGSHIICDQLYSYGGGLNAVIAMSKGLIVAGGGENEMYEMFGEKENHPIINLQDSKEEIVAVLEGLLKRRSELPELAKQSREFALKHHDHIKVAQQYLEFWTSRM